MDEFLSQGAIVIFTFNKHSDKAKKLCADKERLFSHKMNIKQKSSIKTALNYIEKRFKKLDVIVNNAGINKPTDFDKIKEKDWDEILEVNLKGPFMIMQDQLDLSKNQQADLLSM